MDRDKNLQMAMSQIERQYGKGAVMRLGEEGLQKVATISTGALSLDLALGIGGVPRGRIVEIYGVEGGGKTSLALHIIAEAQRNGGIAAFIDAEHALDPIYAKALGVNIDELLISQPDTGEQALEIADMLIRSGALDVLVIDSVAALVPRAEIEGEMGDAHVGLQARLMSQALRKLAGTINRSRTTAIFINQLREKIGVMFGSPEITPGGRALKFYSSVRIEVRRVESIKDASEQIGNRVRAKVVKNKCVAVGTKVFDPTTGLTHDIEAMVGEGIGTSVWAVDKRGELHIRPIVTRLEQGEQEIITLRLRDGTGLRVTPDHLILTEEGWRQAGELQTGDRVARPRRAGSFGAAEPVPPEQARMLGYLIGDGYVGGKTPIAFANTEPSLQADAQRIADGLGCRTSLRHDGIYASFSHRRGERNELLALARWAGIWGHLAPDKRIPRAFFAPDISETVVGNLLFGIWESDGWISREQTGGIRCGFAPTSEQLAWQIHWLLLRWGIGSSVMKHEPGSRRSLIAGRPVVGKLPCWQVRVSGIDNVRRFANALPMWGPKGERLTAELANPALAKHRGARTVYLSGNLTEPIIEHLRDSGITPTFAASLIGLSRKHADGGFKSVLGSIRLRRDRVERLAEALDSAFLWDLLSEDLFYERISAIEGPSWERTFDIEVEELHNFVADDVVVHNCAPPFRNAEFDIMFGRGISREGSLIDVAVDQGIVRKSGAWYTFDDDQLGQGRENAKEFLRENPDVAVQLEARVLAAAGLAEQADPQPEPVEESS